MNVSLHQKTIALFVSLTLCFYSVWPIDVARAADEIFDPAVSGQTADPFAPPAPEGSGGFESGSIGGDEGGALSAPMDASDDEADSASTVEAAGELNETDPAATPLTPGFTLTDANGSEWKIAALNKTQHDILKSLEGRNVSLTLVEGPEDADGNPVYYVEEIKFNDLFVPMQALEVVANTFGVDAVNKFDYEKNAVSEVVGTLKDGEDVNNSLGHFGGPLNALPKSFVLSAGFAGDGDDGSGIVEPVVTEMVITDRSGKDVDMDGVYEQSPRAYLVRYQDSLPVSIEVLDLTFDYLMDCIREPCGELTQTGTIEGSRMILERHPVMQIISDLGAYGLEWIIGLIDGWRTRIIDYMVPGDRDDPGQLSLSGQLMRPRTVESRYEFQGIEDVVTYEIGPDMIAIPDCIAGGDCGPEVKMFDVLVEGESFASVNYPGPGEEKFKGWAQGKYFEAYNLEGVLDFLDERHFMLAQEANLPPVVEAAPDWLETVAGSVAEFQIVASDPEGGPVALELVSINSGSAVVAPEQVGLSLDPDTGLITLQGHENVIPGEYQVTIHAVDQRGKVAEISFMINVIWEPVQPSQVIRAALGAHLPNIDAMSMTVGPDSYEVTRAEADIIRFAQNGQVFDSSAEGLIALKGVDYQLDENTEGLLSMKDADIRFAVDVDGDGDVDTEDGDEHDFLMVHAVDFTGDTLIDAGDIYTAQAMIAGARAGVTAEAFARADVNANGLIDDEEVAMATNTDRFLTLAVTAEEMILGDVDEDGDVDGDDVLAYDYMLLLQPRMNIDGQGGIDQADLDAITRGIEAYENVVVSDANGGIVIGTLDYFAHYDHATGVITFEGSDGTAVTVENGGYFVLENGEDYHAMMSADGTVEVRSGDVRFAVDLNDDNKFDESDVALAAEWFGLAVDIVADGVLNGFDSTRLAEIAEAFSLGVTQAIIDAFDLTGDGVTNGDDFTLFEAIKSLSQSEVTPGQMGLLDYDADGDVEGDDLDAYEVWIAEAWPILDINGDGFLDASDGVDLGRGISADPTEYHADWLWQIDIRQTEIIENRLVQASFDLFSPARMETPLPYTFTESLNYAAGVPSMPVIMPDWVEMRARGIMPDLDGDGDADDQDVLLAVQRTEMLPSPDGSYLLSAGQYVFLELNFLLTPDNTAGILYGHVAINGEDYLVEFDEMSGQWSFTPDRNGDGIIDLNDLLFDGELENALNYLTRFGTHAESFAAASVNQYVEHLSVEQAIGIDALRELLHSLGIVGDDAERYEILHQEYFELVHTIRDVAVTGNSDLLHQRHGHLLTQENQPVDWFAAFIEAENLPDKFPVLELGQPDLSTMERDEVLELAANLKAEFGETDTEIDTAMTADYNALNDDLLRLRGALDSINEELGSIGRVGPFRKQTIYDGAGEILSEIYSLMDPATGELDPVYTVQFMGGQPYMLQTIERIAQADGTVLMRTADYEISGMPDSVGVDRSVTTVAGDSPDRPIAFRQILELQQNPPHMRVLDNLNPDWSWQEGMSSAVEQKIFTEFVVGQAIFADPDFQELVGRTITTVLSGSDPVMQRMGVATMIGDDWEPTAATKYMVQAQLDDMKVGIILDTNSDYSLTPESRAEVLTFLDQDPQGGMFHGVMSHADPLTFEPTALSGYRLQTDLGLDSEGNAVAGIRSPVTEAFVERADTMSWTMALAGQNAEGKDIYRVRTHLARDFEMTPETRTFESTDPVADVARLVSILEDADAINAASDWLVEAMQTASAALFGEDIPRYTDDAVQALLDGGFITPDEAQRFNNLNLFTDVVLTSMEVVRTLNAELLTQRFPDLFDEVTGEIAAWFTEFVEAEGLTKMMLTELYRVVVEPVVDLDALEAEIANIMQKLNGDPLGTMQSIFDDPASDEDILGNFESSRRDIDGIYAEFQNVGMVGPYRMQVVYDGAGTKIAENYYLVSATGEMDLVYTVQFAGDQPYMMQTVENIAQPDGSVITRLAQYQVSGEPDQVDPSREVVTAPGDAPDMLLSRAQIHELGQDPLHRRILDNLNADWSWQEGMSTAVEQIIFSEFVVGQALFRDPDFQQLDNRTITTVLTGDDPTGQRIGVATLIGMDWEPTSATKYMVQAPLDERRTGIIYDTNADFSLTPDSKVEVYTYIDSPSQGHMFHGVMSHADPLTFEPTAVSVYRLQTDLGMDAMGRRVAGQIKPVAADFVTTEDSRYLSVTDLGTDVDGNPVAGVSGPLSDQFEVTESSLYWTQTLIGRDANGQELYRVHSHLDPNFMMTADSHTFESVHPEADVMRLAGLLADAQAINAAGQWLMESIKDKIQELYEGVTLFADTVLDDIIARADLTDSEAERTRNQNLFVKFVLAVNEMIETGGDEQVLMNLVPEAMDPQTQWISNDFVTRVSDLGLTPFMPVDIVMFSIGTTVNLNELQVEIDRVMQELGGDPQVSVENLYDDPESEDDLLGNILSAHEDVRMINALIGELRDEGTRREAVGVAFHEAVTAMLSAYPGLDPGIVIQADVQIVPSPSDPGTYDISYVLVLDGVEYQGSGTGFMDTVNNAAVVELNGNPVLDAAVSDLATTANALLGQLEGQAMPVREYDEAAISHNGLVDLHTDLKAEIRLLIELLGEDAVQGERVFPKVEILGPLFDEASALVNSVLEWIHGVAAGISPVDPNVIVDLQKSLADAGAMVEGLSPDLPWVMQLTAEVNDAIALLRQDIEALRHEVALKQMNERVQPLNEALAVQGPVVEGLPFEALAPDSDGDGDMDGADETLLVAHLASLRASRDALNAVSGFLIDYDLNRDGQVDREDLADRNNDGIFDESDLFDLNGNGMIDPDEMPGFELPMALDVAQLLVDAAEALNALSSQLRDKERMALDSLDEVRAHRGLVNDIEAAIASYEAAKTANVAADVDLDTSLNDAFELKADYAGLYAMIDESRRGALSDPEVLTANLGDIETLKDAMAPIPDRVYDLATLEISVDLLAEIEQVTQSLIFREREVSALVPEVTFVSGHVRNAIDEAEDILADQTAALRAEIDLALAQNASLRTEVLAEENSLDAALAAGDQGLLDYGADHNALYDEIKSAVDLTDPAWYQNTISDIRGLSTNGPLPADLPADLPITPETLQALTTENEVLAARKLNASQLLSEQDFVNTKLDASKVEVADLLEQQQAADATKASIQFIPNQAFVAGDPDEAFNLVAGGEVQIKNTDLPQGMLVLNKLADGTYTMSINPKNQYVGVYEVMFEIGIMLNGQLIILGMDSLRVEVKKKGGRFNRDGTLNGDAGGGGGSPGGSTTATTSTSDNASLFNQEDTMTLKDKAKARYNAS